MKEIHFPELLHSALLPKPMPSSENKQTDYKSFRPFHCRRMAILYKLFGLLMSQQSIGLMARTSFFCRRNRRNADSALIVCQTWPIGITKASKVSNKEEGNDLPECYFKHFIMANSLT